MIYKEDVKDVYERIIKRDNTLNRNEIITLICRKIGVAGNNRNRDKVRKILQEVI